MGGCVPVPLRVDTRSHFCPCSGGNSLILGPGPDITRRRIFADEGHNISKNLFVCLLPCGTFREFLRQTLSCQDMRIYYWLPEIEIQLTKR